MTTSSSQLSTNPDEVCQVCRVTRENHGDKNHKFSTDGQLLPLDPPPKPRAEAPTHRDDAQMLQAKSFATLLEVMVERGMIDARDVIRILTGQG